MAQRIPSRAFEEFHGQPSYVAGGSNFIISLPTIKKDQILLLAGLVTRLKVNNTGIVIEPRLGNASKIVDDVKLRRSPGRFTELAHSQLHP